MIDPISTAAIRPPISIGSTSAVGQAARSSGVADAGSDFASLLGDAISGVAEKLRAAETVSISGIKGTASTQQVVETVMAAEQSLQAAIAVRDKVVNAYMEITRMAI